MLLTNFSCTSDIGKLSFRKHAHVIYRVCQLKKKKKKKKNKKQTKKNPSLEFLFFIFLFVLKTDFGYMLYTCLLRLGF